MFLEDTNRSRRGAYLLYSSVVFFFTKQLGDLSLRVATGVQYRLELEEVKEEKKYEINPLTALLLDSGSTQQIPQQVIVAVEFSVA